MTMYTGNVKLKQAIFNALYEINYVALEGDIDDFIKSLEDNGYSILENGILISLIKNN